jgi:hypothetical protein
MSLIMLAEIHHVLFVSGCMHIYSQVLYLTTNILFLFFLFGYFYSTWIGVD